MRPIPRLMIPSRGTIQSVLESCDSRVTRALAHGWQSGDRSVDERVLRNAQVDALRAIHAAYSIGESSAGVRKRLAELIEIGNRCQLLVGGPHLNLRRRNDYLIAVWMAALDAILAKDYAERITSFVSDVGDLLVGRLLGVPKDQLGRLHDHGVHGELLHALEAGAEQRLRALASFLVGYAESVAEFPWRVDGAPFVSAACGTWSFETLALLRAFPDDALALTGTRSLPLALLEDDSGAGQDATNGVQS